MQIILYKKIYHSAKNGCLGLQGYSVVGFLEPLKKWQMTVAVSRCRLLCQNICLERLLLLYLFFDSSKTEKWLKATDSPLHHIINVVKYSEKIVYKVNKKLECIRKQWVITTQLQNPFHTLPHSQSTFSDLFDRNTQYQFYISSYIYT